MKTRILVLCIIVLSLGTKTVSAQNYYIETTAFDKYLPKIKAENTQYRFNEFNQPTLIFKGSSDSIVKIIVIDYDDTCTIIKKTILVFWLDKNQKDRYFISIKMDEKDFQNIMQKILNQLKEV